MIFTISSSKPFNRVSAALSRCRKWSFSCCNSLSPYKSIPCRRVGCKKNVRLDPNREILLPHIRTYFCRDAPVHTFMFFLTKNSNSKNKNLCASSQNFILLQNWEKISNIDDISVGIIYLFAILGQNEILTRSTEIFIFGV